MCNINWKHFIIKLHYFFLYGGLVCPYSIVQTVMSRFGMNFLAFKITFIISRLFICMSRPVLGFISDKHGNFRNIFMVLFIVTGLLLLAAVYTPPIERKKVESTTLTATCNIQRDEMALHLSTYEIYPGCAKEMEMREIEFHCELSSNCFSDTILRGNFKLKINLTDNFGVTPMFFKFDGINLTNEDCSCLGKNMSRFSCLDRSFYECNYFTRIIPDYEMYNFWIIVCLYTIVVNSSQSLFLLMDVACFKILHKNSNDFGKQRLWGSIGWLVIHFVSGYYASYYISELKGRYFIGFCAMLGFFLTNIFLLCLIPIKKPNSSTGVCKNLRKTFFSIKSVIFLFGTIIFGVFTGLLYNFKHEILWNNIFIDDIFDNLLYSVRYLVEVPFFFFSGWFVNKFGHFCCLIASLVTLTLNMGLWSVLNNKWWALPMELLEGSAYTIFSSAMVLYAVDCALPGTEATTLGIFEGIYEGLGFTIGLILGFYENSILDLKNPRWNSFVASMTILGITLVLTIVYLVISRWKVICNHIKAK